ncbi:n-acetyltransferase domain-containing protein [Caerostris darwini]|uniref:N-acetyltransferase domain-containing protein n=1 Tax=Caerostris darwini TaxID=1538125 RepID=A0AAV4TK45_9ARAC|nr:n-acetyltransferase domain-containing protein [Caerostris darwini]
MSTQQSIELNFNDCCGLEDSGKEKGEQEVVDEAFCSKCTAIQCCKPRDPHENSFGAYDLNLEPVAVRKLFYECSDVKISNGTNTNSSSDLSRNGMNSLKICENCENRSVWNAEEITARVVAYDRSLHNRDRSQLIRHTFSWSSCTTKVALMSGKVVGYGCLRRVITGHWMISPLYADNEVVAEAILFHLLQGFDFSNKKKGVKIHSIDKNFACTKLLKKFGFREWQTLYTAFTKHCVELNISKIYALHSIACSLE